MHSNHKIYKNFTEFSAVLPPIQRIIGIDYGKKRIGVALSDLNRLIATPYVTLDSGSIKKEVASLYNVITEFNVCGAVIGYPYEMSGNEGEMCQQVVKFAKFFLEHLAMENFPILFYDERFSSKIIERSMAELSINRKEKINIADQMAASYILQNVLNDMNSH